MRICGSVDDDKIVDWEGYLIGMGWAPENFAWFYSRFGGEFMQHL